jgi:hypothetical protein
MQRLRVFERGLRLKHGAAQALVQSPPETITTLVQAFDDIGGGP